LIEKKSPGDGDILRSLSCTITSKRHNGEVDFSFVGHALRNNAGDPDVNR
jgi:hypothetical protein